MLPLILLSISSPCWFSSLLSYTASRWFSTTVFYLWHWEILYLSLFWLGVREKGIAQPDLQRKETCVPFIQIRDTDLSVSWCTDCIYSVRYQTVFYIYSWVVFLRDTMWFAKLISYSREKNISFLCTFHPRYGEYVVLVKIVANFVHSFLSLSFYKHLLYVENTNWSVCTVISDDDLKYIIMLCILKKNNCMCKYPSGNMLGL